MISINILDNIINKSKGYDIALFTTFNFEIPFFERNILNSLINNNIKKISLFVDNNNLIEALNNTDSSYIGKKYMVTSIDINKSFHPKLILLLGEKRARLIVSSANLTNFAYTYNNEIFNVFDYNEDDEQYLNIINDSIKYFYNIANKFDCYDKELFEEINTFNYVHKHVDNNNVTFISNYEKSIIEQIVERINDVISIDIAVPFYDDELKALQKIKAIYPDAKINLYIQNKLSTFNFDLYNNLNICNNVFVFNDFKDIGTNAMYHGKVFRFNTKNDSYILYGSANCTLAALFESSSTGNYECDILAKGKLEDYNYYFDNFDLCSLDEERSYRKLDFNKVNSSNFSFKISLEEDILYFKYKNKYDNLKIIVNEKEYKYEYVDNYIKIFIDDNIPFGLINVEFYYDEKRENIKCFIFSKTLLNEFRTSENKNIDLPVDKLINNNDDSFIKYYKMLLGLIPYDVTAINEKKENNKIYREAMDQQNAEEEFDDEFFVNFNIPDEILNKQKEYNRIDSIKREVVNNFILKINNMIANNNKKRSFSSYNNNGKNDDNNDNKNKREPRTEEARFVSYIKRTFKNVINKECISGSNIKDYIDNILLLLNVVYTYNDENDVKAFNVYDFTYLIIDFLDSILEYDMNELDDNTVMMLKVFLFISLLQNNIYENEDNNQKKRAIDLINNRRILLSYDKKYNLKNNYDDYVDLAISLIDYEISFDDAKLYIEKLFDYLNEDELINFIQNKSFGEVEVNIINNVFMINIKTTQILRYLKPTYLEGIIEKIKNRYKHVGTINGIIINIYNKDVNVNYENPMDIVRYTLGINDIKIKRYFKKKLDNDFIFISEERL